MNKENKKKILSLEDKLESAKLYHRGGNLEKAEKLYREVLKEEPYNAQATHLLGLLAMQTGKLEIAKYLIETAIKLDPNDPVFYVNLGVVYYLKKEFKKAKELFEKAIDMDPDYAEAYANMGKLLAEEGNFSKSREFLLKAINLGDQEPSTLITLAEVNYKIGLYDKVVNLCMQMIHELDIDENQVIELLVKSLLKLNKPLEAAEYLEILLQRDSKNPEYQKYKEEIYKNLDLDVYSSVKQ